MKKVAPMKSSKGQAKKIVQQWSKKATSAMKVIANPMKKKSGTAASSKATKVKGVIKSGMKVRTSAGGAKRKGAKKTKIVKKKQTVAQKKKTVSKMKKKVVFFFFYFFHHKNVVFFPKQG